MAEDTTIYTTGFEKSEDRLQVFTRGGIVDTDPVVETGITDTLAERETTHGNFAVNAVLSQRLKEKIRLGVGYSSLNTAQCEALDMICTKIGRIVNGNPNHIDNWHDIAGYATLVERELAGVENTEPRGLELE